MAPPSSSEEESESSEESEEEDRVVMSIKDQRKALKNKTQTGKWQKQTPYYNAQDRFILL